MEIAEFADFVRSLETRENTDAISAVLAALFATFGDDEEPTEDKAMQRNDSARKAMDHIKDNHRRVEIMGPNAYLLNPHALADVQASYDGTLRISSLLVFPDADGTPRKGQGWGSNALDALVGIADLFGATMTLSAQPFGHSADLDETALKEWYGRRGFTGPAGFMKRIPK